MEQLKFKKYNNVVSFGCMCSLALYLKKIGLRSKSCFFDWITSNIADNLELVNNNFEDFFNINFFKQEYPSYPHLITNTKYNFVYTHVFNSKETFKKQYKKVQKRVQRGIDNFYNSLSDSCLLIYYSRSLEENSWIEKNQNKIYLFCKKYNVDFLFVLNFDITEKFIFPKFVIPQNNVHKPNGGAVSYPFENTSLLDQYLLSHYDDDKRHKNLKFKSKKHLIRRIKTKLLSKRKDKLELQ